MTQEKIPEEVATKLSLMISIRSEPIVLVAIAGGSCSGKSYFMRCFSNHLTEQGNSHSLLRLDDYFKDIDDPTLPRDDKRRVIFDSPNSYRHELFLRHLRELARGKSVDCPVYDLANNRVVLAESKKVLPQRIILAEGLHAIRFVELIKKDRHRFYGVYSIAVFIDASTETRLARRIERDKKLFNVAKELVENYFFSKVEPAHQEFIEPQRNLANLIVEDRPS